MTAVRAAGAERHGGRLLFVGRLAEKKGVAVLLRAARLAGTGRRLVARPDRRRPAAPAARGDRRGLGAIIASSLPGIDAALVDGHTGLLVPPGDSAALAAAVSKLLRDGELRAKLGGAAAEAVDDYSIQAVGDQYIDLLNSLAQPSR